MLIVLETFRISLLDLMSNEMKNMRQQLEYLQAELNKELSRELHEYHSRRAVVEPRETDAEDGSCFVKRDGLKKGLQSMDASGYLIQIVSNNWSRGNNISYLPCFWKTNFVPFNHLRNSNLATVKIGVNKHCVTLITLLFNIRI
ncbi:kinesin-like protein KIN-4B [Camellia sinensis]|uniref:kinesin-like protein KIN-4B n=1 Tax=Camellia sinensis TaxID=4442 RepID=UPI0010369E9B|nr:kinesin-like protein KIN-4B [Camellia sinensis]